MLAFAKVAWGTSTAGGWPAWTTHGQNPCDFRPGPGCYGGSGYRASSRTDVPLGRCPRHTPFGPCWRFSVFSLSTSTLWAKAGVPVLRLRSSVSRDCGVTGGAPRFFTNCMRPKRTFFRAERVRVVPPEGESPPQAPPEALPAAGAAGGPARRRRSPAGLLWRACEGLDLAASRAPAGLARSADPRAAELARPQAGPGGTRTQPSLLAPTRGGWKGPLCGTGTQRGEQAQWQGREFDTSHVNWHSALHVAMLRQY